MKNKTYYEVLITDGTRKGNYLFPESATIADIFKLQDYKPVDGSVRIKLWDSGKAVKIPNGELQHIRLSQCPYAWFAYYKRVSILLRSKEVKT